MTYDLFIGDRMFSSWSLRGWLMLEKFGLPYRTHLMGLYSGTFSDDMSSLAPARMVPALRTADGHVIGETIAIAETLAERHPDAGLWPQDPNLRMRARWLCAEMATGFSAVRRDCPMQLAHVNAGFVPSPAVKADVARIELLWRGAQNMAGTTASWLFGDYSLADVFYTPVAARIIGHGLDVSDSAQAYCMRLLSDPAIKKWRGEALDIVYEPFPYPTFPPLQPWPVE